MRERLGSGPRIYPRCKRTFFGASNAPA